MKLDRRLNPDKYNLIPNHDEVTGQTLFKPRVIQKSPGPLGNESARSELNPKFISEYLYRHGQIMQQKKE